MATHRAYSARMIGGCDLHGSSSGHFSLARRLRYSWTTMCFPMCLDYQGPPGMILMRQGLARIKFPDSTRDTTVALGVEQPYSDIQWEENGEFVVNPGTGIITDPDLDRNVQNMPDFTGNIRHDYDYGHMQTAGIFTTPQFSEAATEDEFDETGYGGNLTGTWHPYAWCTGCSPKCTSALLHAKEPIPRTVCGWQGNQSVLPRSKRVGLRRRIHAGYRF